MALQRFHSIPIHTFYEIYTFKIFQRISLHFWCAKHKTMIRVRSMSADALVSDAARAPVDIMLPMHVHLQTRSFNWCRFLSYSCTVFMWTHVRKFNLPCVTSVTWTNLSLYLIITWRIKKTRQHDDLIVPVNTWSSIYVGEITKLSF